MNGIYKHATPAKIRLYISYSLIFFVAGTLLACQQPEKATIALAWQGQKATGLFIPQGLLQTLPTDSLHQLLTIRLANQETAIAGNYKPSDHGVVFEPLIPFTRGLSYSVWLRNKPLGTLHVPTLSAAHRPVLLAIYPTQDSLPDNLLKIYLHFSQPMREGRSKQYVHLVKNGIDTLPNVFLDLQPELWNPSRTTLTLWLDPGRIKRDLQPNQQLGAPLQAGTRYQLVVSANWPDAQGTVLGKSTTHSFLAIQRDSLSPQPASWSISSPPVGSLQPVVLSFGEPLDYSLLTEAIRILDADGQPVTGTWQLGKDEKQSQFSPLLPWQTGRYRLRIESRLEDLAGNNVNRTFDRDVTKNDHSTTAKPFVERSFWVR